MAYSVETVSRISRNGDTTIRPARTRRFLSGAAFVGAGVAVAMWCVFATAIHSLGTAPSDANRLTELKLVAEVPSHGLKTAKERLVRVSKAERLRPWADDKKVALTTDAVRAYGLARRDQAELALAKAANAQALNKPDHAAEPVQQVAAAVPVVSAAKIAPVSIAQAPGRLASSERIVIPSKDEVAAAERRELLALAAVPALVAAPLAATPAGSARPGAPVKAPEQEVASIENTDDAPSSPTSASSAFGLVLSEREADVPLPMARPKTPSGAGTGRGSEPVLAYAKAETEGEDDGDDITPRIRKPAMASGRGVAIYDISAGTVYLPSGERLEAHSGLGKMRDNPRFVDQKMRGPTPPHTYALTMRESLFHGVEAIRLTPLGGAGAIHNRVGLLAHTYMLGARGDSNGCVSFKDYKRFLAAFKRGDIRQLVVVARMSDAPAMASASVPGAKKTLASMLFSKN